MMRPEDGDGGGVLIGGNRASLRLTRLGHRGEAGWPAWIALRAGPFSGSTRDDTEGNLPRFREEARPLHRTLPGSAILEGQEGLRLALTGNGLGGIAIAVDLSWQTRRPHASASPSG